MATMSTDIDNVSAIHRVHKCKAIWVLDRLYFPCLLELGHPGPHVNYPMKEGHDAVIIWSNTEVQQ